MRPENGRESTADMAKAPIIRPTCDSAPRNSLTTKSGKIANNRNMLPEKRKVLRQINKKSRVKSSCEVEAKGRGGGAWSGNGRAGCDTTGECSECTLE